MKLGRRRGFKSWFVEPYKQVKLGLMFLLVNLVFSVLILAVFGYFVIDIYQAVSTYFRLSQYDSLLTLTKFGVPVIAGVGLIGLFVVTTILVSVRYTHDIYGPLVSIHRFLDELLIGNKPPIIQLRESDQLKDLADKLNKLAERLIEDQRSGEMVAIYRHLDLMINGQHPPALQLRDSDHMRELVEKINQLSEKEQK